MNEHIDLLQRAVADLHRQIGIEPEKPEKPDDLLADFVRLDKRRRELEAELDQVTGDLRVAQEKLLDEWADRGQSQARVDGLTVYVAHEFFCSKKTGVDTRVVCDVLRRHGLGLLVAEGYNAQGLKALIKEKVEAGEDVPADLAELISYDTVPRLRTRARS